MVCPSCASCWQAAWAMAWLKLCGLGWARMIEMFMPWGRFSFLIDFFDQSAHRQSIRPPAEPGNLPQADGSDVRMMAKFFAGMDVGKMGLYGWQPDGRHRIAYGNR